MQVSKFVNNLDGDSLHTNEYAGGTTSSQSFTERKAVEQNRQTIGAYRHSQLGSNFAPRGEYARPKPRKFVPKDHTSHSARQTMNSGDRGGSHDDPASTPSRQPGSNVQIPTRQQFHEPPGRTYNPYA